MKPNRSGYILLEMVAALSLMTVFLVLAGQLFKQVASIQRDAVNMEWSVSQMEFALRQLRQDTWSASGLELMGEDAVTFEFAEGYRVAWSFAAEPSERFPARGWLRRERLESAVGETRGGVVQRYEVPARPTYTSPSPGRLIMVVGEQASLLSSQVMTAHRAERNTERIQP